MPYQQLEINKFSGEGEVLRKIRCLAGRVTVFRSQSDQEIEKFKKALEGKPQQDRFSVLLDGGPFHPQKNVFIGFGPLDEAPSQFTVGDYLRNSGVDTSIIENILLQFGLGGLSNQSCSTLNPVEWKILRIVSSCHSPESSKVLCIHEPFDDVPEKFKDPIADRLAKFAWEKQAIIIITKLSYRPSVWIENDYIARVQLERPRQGTIGFGGGESAIAEHLATLRKEHGGSDKSSISRKGPDLLSTKSGNFDYLKKQFNSPRVVGLSLSLAAVIFGYAYLLWQTSAPLGSESAEISVVSNNLNPKSSTESPFNSNQNGKDFGNQGSQNALTPATKSIIDGFPEPVQIAWVSAIEHPGSLLRPQKAAVSTDSSNQEGQDEELRKSPIEALYLELTKK